MAGGPSQLELFDHKPELNKLHGKPMPESFIEGQAVRLHDKGDAEAARHARASSSKAGKCGMDVSDLLPHHRDDRGRHRAGSAA